ARPPGLDSAEHGADPHLLLLHAAAEPECRVDPGQHQLRVGTKRRRGADLGVARRLGCRSDRRHAAPAVRTHPCPFPSHHAAGATRADRMSFVSPAAPTRWIALRLALRELRSGLRGFYVFIACIALGVMAIAGVGSVATSLENGLAREGSVILGGDLSFNLSHREVTASERAFLESQGRISVAPPLRPPAPPPHRPTPL